MKRKLVIAVILLAMSFTFVGCGNKSSQSQGQSTEVNKTDNEDDKQDKSDSEDYFQWSADDSISGLTDEGKKQEKIIIPEKCKSIVGVIVTEDSNVKDISFEGTITGEFSSQYFIEANSSIEKLAYPEGIEKLAAMSLYLEKNLKEITFPKSLKTIDDYAIEDCEAIEKIDLTDTSVSYIGTYAFQGCNSIKEVYLPETIKEIGSKAFPSSVTDIYVPEGAVLTTYSEDNVFYSEGNNVNVHVKEGSWADLNFENWFSNETIYTKVYD